MAGDLRPLWKVDPSELFISGLGDYLTSHTDYKGESGIKDITVSCFYSPIIFTTMRCLNHNKECLLLEAGSVYPITPLLVSFVVER